MTLETQKEQFSIAYVRAVSAAAGIAVEQVFVDNDSVDLSLRQVATGAVYRSPQLDVQLKCSAVSSLTLGTDHISYPLKLKNYNDLRATNLIVPRCLIVVLVPDDVPDWLTWASDEMSIRKAGYWLNLHGMADTANVDSVTVHVPLAQEFSPAQLLGIMGRVADGGRP